MTSTPTPHVANLDIALALLEKGLHIFPLGGYAETPPQYFIDRCEGDAAEAAEKWPKTPRVSWKAYQSAPPSEEQVTIWWTQYPSANIGIACGALIVVDADSAESVEWCQKHLPHTPWRVITGKGMHFYYRRNPLLDIRNSADPLAKIDMRGQGGYVVAAGSRHFSGAYYADAIDTGIAAPMVNDLPLLDQATLDQINSYRTGNIAAKTTAPTTGRANLAGFDASKIKTAATGDPVTEGGRNNAAASLAGQLFAQGLSLRDTKSLLDSWNSSNPRPLSDSELNTTIGSVKRTHEHNHPDQPVPLDPPKKPEPATQNKKSVKRFPAGLLTPPGLVGEIASYITCTAIKPQPVLSLGAALTLCGTIMGRKVKSPTDLRTNLYIIGIGDSASGKEHPRQAIKRLLDACDALNMIGGEDIASDAGLFATVFRQPSCILLLDEIGRFLEGANNKNAAQHRKDTLTVMMRLHSSAPSIYLQKKLAEHIETDTRSIHQPNLSIFGTTVPNRLYRGIKVDDIIDGFVPRFLLVHSDDPDPDKQYVTSATPPPSIIETMRMWIERPVNSEPEGNLDLKPRPLLVDFTPDAQIVFDAFEATNRIRKAKTRGSGIDAIWGRADANAIQVALIVACGCSYEAPVIDRAHAEWATEFVTFVLDRAIAEIDVNMAENEYEGDLKKVLTFVASKGKVDKRDIQRKFRAIKNEALNGILAALQQTGDIEVGVELPTGGIGRPSHVISMCPGQKDRTI